MLTYTIGHLNKVRWIVSQDTIAIWSGSGISKNEHLWFLNQTPAIVIEAAKAHWHEEFPTGAVFFRSNGLVQWRKGVERVVVTIGFESSNSIIVVATKDQMPKWEELIREEDVP